MYIFYIYTYRFRYVLVPNINQEYLCFPLRHFHELDVALRFAGEITGKNPNYINAGRPGPW